MMSNVVQLRRDIDEPGEFLDWLIDKGWSQRSAALLIADARSEETQHLLRGYLLERVEAEAS